MKKLQILLVLILILFQKAFSAQNTDNSAFAKASADTSSSSSSISAPSLHSSSSLSGNDQEVIKKVQELIKTDRTEPWFLLTIALTSNYVIDKAKKDDALNLLLKNLINKIDLNKKIGLPGFYSHKEFLLECAENEEDFKTLVDAGANVNQMDENGNTLLMRQLKNFIAGLPINFGTIKFLLQNNANPNLSKNNQTFITILDNNPVFLPYESDVSKSEKISIFEKIRKIYDEVQRPKIVKEILQSTILPIELAKMITQYQQYTSEKDLTQSETEENPLTI